MIERSAVKQAKPAPRLDLDGVEWKAAIAAWLGVVYLVSWFSVRGPEPSDPAPAQAPERSSGPAASRSEQPVSQAGRSAAAAAPARSRPAIARPSRVRTRSS